MQRHWPIQHPMPLKHVLLFMYKAGESLAPWASLPDLHSERVKRKEVSDTAGQCLHDGKNTYEDFGFERLNVLLTFLAEWRSSCSCRLFWGTAAMILNSEEKNYQHSHTHRINHSISWGVRGWGWSTVPPMPRLIRFFWVNKLFWHFLQMVKFKIYNL